MQLIEHTMTVEEGQEIVIAPLGDIQYTGREEAVAGSKLDQHIERAVDKGAWFVGTGDYVDFMSPSNRKRLKNADLYDSSQGVIEDKAADLVDEFYWRFLELTHGRWLGLVHGHHYAECGNGKSTDQLLAEKLGCEYLGTHAYICLKLLGPKGRKGRVYLWVHHGEGSGMLGYPIQKLLKGAANWPQVDFFIMGHTTQRGVAPLPRLRADFKLIKPILRDRETWLVSAGGWSRAYQEGSQINGRPTGGYVEQGMMTPVALGAPLLTILPYWGKKRLFEPELRAEA